MTTGLWHGPRVRNMCKNAVNVGLCVLVLRKRLLLRKYSFCSGVSKHEDAGHIPIANSAAGLFFHKFILVLGVCQPTTVESCCFGVLKQEREGKAISIMAMQVMMMMMMMMMMVMMTMMMIRMHKLMI